MNTGILSSIRSRRLLLPALAVLISLFLLGAGFTGLAWAKTGVGAPPAEPAAPDAPFDLQITKSHLPTIFTAGPENYYYINVSRTNTGTISTPVLVEDVLPSGMTWTPANIGKWNCLSTSTPTKLSCYYTEANPQNFDLISFAIDVPSTPGVTTVTNYANLILADGDGDLTNNSDDDPTTINNSLTISKNVTPAYATPVYVGQPVIFTIVVSNNTALNIPAQVTDILNSALTYESCTVPAGATCSYNSSTSAVNITNLNIAGNSSATITIQARPNSTVTTEKTITNNARVFWSSPTISALSNTAQVLVRPAETIDFDLQIIKSHAPITFTVGSGNIYFINVSRKNTNTINASVLIEDNLPNGLTWTPVAAIGKWNCSTSTTTKVSCYYTEANPQNFDQISFNVNVPANIAVSSVTNVASLLTTDAITTNNTASDVTPISNKISLSINKSVSPVYPTPIYVGQQAVFTLVVANTGTTAATNVKVEDVLAGVLTYESASPCTISGASGSCSYIAASKTVQATFSTLAAGATATITIRARANNGVAAELTLDNYATLTWGSPAVSIQSNTVQMLFRPAADLKVTKTDNLSYVQAGQNVIYTINIENVGSLPADGIFIEDTLVSSPLISWVSVNKNGLLMTEVISTTTTGRWLLNQTLEKDDEVTFYITVRVSASAGGGNVTNSVRVFSSVITDYNLSNDSASDTDAVLATNNDVEVEKTINSDPDLDNIFYVGQPVTFILRVKNNNSDSPPKTFTFVTVNDTLPSGLDFMTCSVAGGNGYCSYNSSNRNVQTLIYNLPPNPDVLITITARVNSTITTPKSLSNSASATWESNTRASNTVSFQVAPAADLVVGKNDGITSVIPNSFVTYTVSITNAGSLSAINLQALDTLSPEQYLHRVIRTGLESATLVTTTGSVLLTNLPVLAPGARITFQIVAWVHSDAPVGSSVVNTIQASTTTPEYRSPAGSSFPPDDRNIASDTDTVTAAPAMSIKKTVSDSTVAVGEAFAFTILVKNDGSVTVYNIVVTDNLPTVVDIVSAETDKGTLITSGRLVTVNVGNLTAGKAFSILIKVKVNSTAVLKEKYTNVAKMTYNPSYSLQDDAAFRIGKGGTLPGTGFGPAGLLAAPPVSTGPAEGDLERLGSLALSAGGLLAALGLAALGYGVISRRRRPEWARWYLGAGLILILSSAAFGCAAFGINQATSTSPPAALNPSQEVPTQPPPTQAVVLASPTAESPGQGGQPTAPPQPTATPEPTPTLHPVEQQISDLQPTPTPATLPDYPIPTPAIRPTLGPNGIPADDSAVTRLVIPTMRLDAVVKFVPYNGDTWLIGGLRWEIAWMGDTSWPGLGGNTGLAGHVDFSDGSAGPFWNLNTLKRGDEVVVYSQRNIYIYQVREQKIVEDSDFSVIQPTTNPQITLITCTEWDGSLNLYLKRLIVFADLVDIRPLP